MQVMLIQIGNSKGIRIPQKILESLGFKEKIDLEVIDDYGILIKPAGKKPRENWDDTFYEMHQNKDDQLIIQDDLDLEYIAELEW